MCVEENNNNFQKKNPSTHTIEIGWHKTGNILFSLKEV